MSLRPLIISTPQGAYIYYNPGFIIFIELWLKKNIYNAYVSVTAIILAFMQNESQKSRLIMRSRSHYKFIWKNQNHFIIRCIHVRLSDCIQCLLRKYKSQIPTEFNKILHTIFSLTSWVITIFRHIYSAAYSEVR